MQSGGGGCKREALLKHRTYFPLVVILLIAWALRVVQFEAAPPGLIHDEVRNWLNIQLIYNGDIRVLYPYGGGREAFYLFIQAASFNLIGTNVYAARLPSLMFSMLGVAISYAFAKRLFGRSAGLIAALGFAVSFWGLMFARLAVRTGSMPVVALIAAYVYLRAVQRPVPRWWLYLLAGGLLGLTLYTYPSALIFPAVVGAWLVLHFLLERPSPRHIAPAVVSLMVMAAVIAPLVSAWRNPDATARADAVSAPLEALQQGDPSLVLANVGPVLGVFTVRGDVGLEFNVQNQPIFPTLPLGILFYLGVGWAIVGLIVSPRYRSGYALCLIWLVGLLVPTLVTEDPVNPSRTIGLLGIVYVFPAIVVCAVDPKVSAPLIKRDKARGLQVPRGFLGKGVLIIVSLALLIELAYTTRAYFSTWNQNEVVEFLYQREYREIADELDGVYAGPEVAIAGLTPYELDPATMQLYFTDDQLALGAGYFDPQTALLIPYHRPGTACVVLPDFVSLHPVLTERLDAWGYRDQFGNQRPRVRACGGFHSQLSPIYDLLEQPPLTSFSQGAQALASLIAVEVVQDANPMIVLTYWQTHQASPNELRIFLHAVDANDVILAQSDVLSVPAQQWRDGDLFVQVHELPMGEPSGVDGFNVGVYQPGSGVRLSTSDGRDMFSINN